MYILGINSFHADSSACLIEDGLVVAAAEEERFRRLKHWAGFPSMAIEYCLKSADLSISQVDHIAVNQDSTANLKEKVRYSLTHTPDVGLVMDRIRNKKKRSRVVDLLKEEYPGEDIHAEFHAVEHHVAHLSSAFHCSPFEKATAVSVDGFGDFASTAWGLGEGKDIELEGRIYFPHSLGIFYQALTQFLGFPNYGDEYKVMGLASYGAPDYLDEMKQIVMLEADGSFKLNLDFFNHHTKRISFDWSDGVPKFLSLFTAKLERLLGPGRRPDEPIEARHKNLAHSVQAMYENAFFNLLNALHERHGCDSLAVAGGCGMNSVANGKIRTRTPFRKTYIQAAAGDAGGALGAAYSVWHGLGNESRVPMRHAAWGPEFSDVENQRLLSERETDLNEEGCTVTAFDEHQELCDEVVDCILQGGVVGWFQGRMEWGPRALGNRSILCDPRRDDMKDILNLKIKRRESFRPFAPSVLREYVSDWFEEDDDVPFMMKVFLIREERRHSIPAVTHVDGTGRLQTVHKDINPLYWQLIDTFRKKTDVPMLLNTSFNENEPIVCTPEEAMNCFLRTNMDMLVLGRWVIRRNPVNG